MSQSPLLPFSHSHIVGWTACEPAGVSHGDVGAWTGQPKSLLLFLLVKKKNNKPVRRNYDAHRVGVWVPRADEGSTYSIQRDLQEPQSIAGKEYLCTPTWESREFANMCVLTFDSCGTEDSWMKRMLRRSGWAGWCAGGAWGQKGWLQDDVVYVMNRILIWM